QQRVAPGKPPIHLRRQEIDFPVRALREQYLIGLLDHLFDLSGAFQIGQDVNSVRQFVADHFDVSLLFGQPLERNESVISGGAWADVGLVDARQVESDCSNVLFAFQIEALDDETPRSAGRGPCRTRDFNENRVAAGFDRFPQIAQLRVQRAPVGALGEDYALDLLPEIKLFY